MNVTDDAITQCDLILHQTKSQTNYNKITFISLSVYQQGQVWHVTSCHELHHIISYRMAPYHIELPDRLLHG